MVLVLEDVPVRDLSWTSGMYQLHRVELYGTNLQNLDFLKDLGVSIMELCFAGNIDDYSGLAAIPNYSTMHLNPKNQNVGAVLPYIVNSSFSTLWLYDCNGIDFSALPQQINKLWITGGNLTNLEGISILPKMNWLILEDMDRLTSLKGLADCETLTNVTITNCNRLADFEDLYQKPFAEIELMDLPISPDLARLQITDYGNLSFENMSCITDISPLEACKSNILMLQLRNMNAITDLSALKLMHVSTLVVPPQLEEQATQLRDDHYINSCEVYYPEDVLWAEDEQNFTLLSLEELDTLPDALLERVTELTIVGDQVPDPDTQEVREEWENNEQHFFLFDRVSEELTPVGAGVIKQIDRLDKLTHLQYLSLLDQPLTSLQGIQTFSDLRRLEIRKCPVADAAAVFTLTQLEELSLFSTQVASIQGIQNLVKLRRIDFNSSQVTDLSPLTECDFGYAMENGGLRLDLAYIPCEEFSALASIPAFEELNMDGHDVALWLPYIDDRSIGVLSINHCNITNDQIASIAAIPQLRELRICWNEKITDLSPLLTCKTLEKIIINSDNTDAIASVEGKTQFSIEFWG
jgi:Leucine-rich repeat (LRR) protein